jgi:uncharacterized protein with PIN domain
MSKVEICPKCNNKMILLPRPSGTAIVDVSSFFEVWKCPKCGYTEQS